MTALFNITKSRQRLLLCLMKHIPESNIIRLLRCLLYIKAAQFFQIQPTSNWARPVSDSHSVFYARHSFKQFVSLNCLNANRDDNFIYFYSVFSLKAGKFLNVCSNPVRPIRYQWVPLATGRPSAVYKHPIVSCATAKAALDNWWEGKGN